MPLILRVKVIPNLDFFGALFHLVWHECLHCYSQDDFKSSKMGFEALEQLCFCMN